MQPKSNLMLGAILSVATAFLLATQAPLSLLATKSISLPAYILVTEVTQICCVPFMLRTERARRDFRSLISQPRNVPKFSLLLAIGVVSLLLFAFGLGKGHPVVIAAVLNLDPFWAALIAFVVAGKTIPTSPWTFGVCLVIAFAGALLIAVSQADSSSLSSIGLASFVGAAIAMPVPILTALSGSLIGKWFPKCDDSASLAVTFLTAAVPTIPIALAIIFLRSGLQVGWELLPAVALLAMATVVSGVVGRVVYQRSLSITDNDNGFVSMFFLLIPAFTCLLSLSMSPWIKGLEFRSGSLFYAGLIVVACALFFFSWRSWRATAGSGKTAESKPSGSIRDVSSWHFSEVPPTAGTASSPFF